MTTFTLTITATLDGDTPDEIWQDWQDLLTQPRFVTDGTVIVNPDDPTNPDTIWHSLTLAAKTSWIAAMQPEPEPDDGGDPYRPVFSNPQAPAPPTINPDDVKTVVMQYVWRVEQNTGPTWNARQDVLDAIRLDGERGDEGEFAAARADVIYEMLEVAGELGLYTGNDDDDADAWWDAVEDALPAVAAALEVTP